MPACPPNRPELTAALRPRRAGWLQVAVAAAWLSAALPSLADEAPPAVRDEGLLRKLLREQAQAHENGEGVERDPVRAAADYCEAARLGDAESQYNLAWMYANGRGVERNDSTAAFFFHAAAEQGLPQAVRMLNQVGGPSPYTPDCMRERAPAAAVALARQPRPLPSARPAAPAPELLRAAEVRSNAPQYLLDLVKKAAPEYKVQPQLALSIMEVESNFDSVALSPRNAKGLMQLIPETAARFNVRNAYDPEQNIRGGLAYLRWLLAYYEGDVVLVAAAYNAGEGAVNRYRGVPPYAETRAYVQRILAGVRAVTHPFDPGAAEPSPQLRQIREQRRER
jgi:soluble lytic murein transglycosylase-like protein